MSGETRITNEEDALENVLNDDTALREKLINKDYYHYNVYVPTTTFLTV